MFCAISGQVAQNAVFVPKTGLVYEEALLRKALESGGGKCPVTGVAIVMDAEDGREADVFAVKTSPVTVPRPPSASSFPSILGALQNEWDSLLLEQVQLRKELLETRKDLATALYEREAASAVIARLLKENDSLKAELEKGGGSASNAMQVDEASNGASFENDISSTESALRDARTKLFKGGNVQPSSLSGGALVEKVSMTPHTAKKPGVSCVAVESYDVSKGNQATNWVVSGGVDGGIKIIDPNAQQIVTTLSKHSTRVNDLCLRGGIITSASADKTVAVWTGDWTGGDAPSLQVEHVIKAHSKAVHACPIHPSCKLASSAGLDGKWTLFDLETADVVTSYSEKSLGALRAARYHPDGKLFGVGGDAGNLSIFDLGAGGASGPVVELPHEHQINSVAFSENGYLLASAGGKKGSAKIWDLRKPGTVVADIQCEGEATSLMFDFTGTYLAIGNSKGGVQVVEKPKKKKGDWTSVVSIPDFAKSSITALCFEPGANGIWASSMDRSVKLYK